MTDEERLALKQAELMQQAQQVLRLTEPYYPAREAAHLLGISLRRLYIYLRDPRLHIKPLYAEEHRRRLLWAADIRRIWVLRHSAALEQSA